MRDDEGLAEVHRRYRQTGDCNDRDRLVLAYRPLVRSVARRFRRGREPVEDLEQVAYVALIKAIDRFEPDRQVRFWTYAREVVIGELKRHLRDHAWALRVPRSLKESHLNVTGEVGRLRAELGRSPTISEIAERVCVSEEAVLAAMEVSRGYRLGSLDAPRFSDGAGIDPGGDDEALVALEERLAQRAVIARLLARLSADERLMVGLYYFHGLDQREIGRRVGCSQMQVSRTIRRALGRLRAYEGWV